MEWQWRKRIYMWYCAAAYVSFLLVFLGLASSTWAELSTDSQSQQWGLLAYCKHFKIEQRHECAALDFGQHPVWFDVIRMFVALSFVLLFSLTPVSCYLYFQDDRREDLLPLTLYGVCTATFGLIGAIVYGAMRDASHGKLSWGFAVFIAGHLTLVLGFLALYCLNLCKPKRKTTVKPYYLY